MQPTAMLSFLLCLLVLRQAAGQESADPPGGDVDEKTAAQLVQLYQQDAGEYDFRLSGAEGPRLKLQTSPVFVWQNNTRGGSPSQFGAVFVWTHAGRAEVIGTIFSQVAPTGQRAVKHEFHSLSLSPLLAHRPAGQVQWSPSAAGLTPKLLADAPRPAASPAQRLLQMRNLAREFTAESIDRRGRWELRLLPRPLHRREGTTSPENDGALFAFVSSAGTDPEVILVIETQSTPDGPRWHYGAARFSDLNLFVKHNDTLVWSFERGSQQVMVEATVKDRYRFINDRMIDLAELQGR
jgi:hypothetical protein